MDWVFLYALVFFIFLKAVVFMYPCYQAAIFVFIIFLLPFLFEKTFFFRCFAGSPLRMEEYDSVVEYRTVG